jgi:hypothetical protein
VVWAGPGAKSLDTASFALPVRNCAIIFFLQRQIRDAVCSVVACIGTLRRLEAAAQIKQCFQVWSIAEVVSTFERVTELIGKTPTIHSK